MEKWVDLYDYDRDICYKWLYKISNYGRIRSEWKSQYKSFSRSSSWKWYYQVSLRKGNIWTNISIHRLVKSNFDCHSTLHIDHLDGDKLNNHIDNLDYVTPKENNRRARENWQHNQYSKPILQYTLQWDFVKELKSAQDAYRQTWISWSAIWRNLIWKSKSSWWYIWIFKDWEIKTKIPPVKPTKVQQFTLDWEYIQTFNSQSEAWRELWLDSSSISRVCKWRNRHCWWFIFKMIY